MSARPPNQEASLPLRSSFQHSHRTERAGKVAPQQEADGTTPTVRTFWSSKARRYATSSDACDRSTRVCARSRVRAPSRNCALMNAEVSRTPAFALAGAPAPAPAPASAPAPAPPRSPQWVRAWRRRYLIEERTARDARVDIVGDLKGKGEEATRPLCALLFCACCPHRPHHLHRPPLPLSQSPRRPRASAPGRASSWRA